MRREHIESGLIFTPQRVSWRRRDNCEGSGSWRSSGQKWAKMGKRCMEVTRQGEWELHLGLLNSLTSLSWGEIFGHGMVFCIFTSFGIFLVGLTIFCRWVLLGASCPCVSVCQLNCSTVKSVVARLSSRLSCCLIRDYSNKTILSWQLILTDPGAKQQRHKHLGWNVNHFKEESSIWRINEGMPMLNIFQWNEKWMNSLFHKQLYKKRCFV